MLRVSLAQVPGVTALYGGLHNMRKWLAVWGMALVVGVVAADARVDYILNTKRIDTGKVAVTCANGADATSVKVGSVLIIDCGK